MPDLTVSNLFKRFGDVEVLKDVDFMVNDGEFFTLLGPSGCGKSTTLNCVAGLERPDEGRISVADEVFFDSASNVFMPPEARNLGMVFQSYALWPHMTVAQNLALPLKIRKASKAEREERIASSLDMVGLADLSGRYPHELSGGQQQRVALARSLAYSPEVLLLDEPLSNLDAKLREQARAWLKQLQSELGITTVYVTHDQDEAMALSDRVAVMSNGRMMQVAPPEEIYERPAVPEVAAFIGRYSFLPGVVTSSTSARCDVRLDGLDRDVAINHEGGLPTGTRITVAMRPETTRLVEPTSTTDNVVPSRIVHSAYVGSKHEYELIVGDRTVYADSSQGGRSGDVHIAIDPDHALIYEGDGLSADDETSAAQTVVQLTEEISHNVIN